MDHGVGEVVVKEKKFMGRVTDDGGERLAEAVPVPEAARAAAGGPVGHVRYCLGTTLNMGDYRSVRVEVQVDLPCKPSLASVDLVHDFAKNWVEGKINREIEEWTGETAVKYLPEAPPDGRKKR